MEVMTLAGRAIMVECGCGHEVLSVEIAGREVALDKHEIDCPPHACIRCGPAPHPNCDECLGTGRAGEVTPYGAIAVDEPGSARRWRRGYPRRPGEGFYRIHDCEEGRAA